MAVVLDFSVKVVHKESLNSIVELVLVEVSPHLAQEVVRPVRVLHSVQVPVVVDDVQSSLEVFKVKGRVKSLTGSG